MADIHAYEWFMISIMGLALIAWLASAIALHFARIELLKAKNSLLTTSLSLSHDTMREFVMQPIAKMESEDTNVVVRLTPDVIKALYLADAQISDVLDSCQPTQGA